MWLSSSQQLGAIVSQSLSAPAAPVHQSTRKRKCRPGYKSPAKQARSKERSKHFNLVSHMRKENFNLTAEIGNLKSYINLVDKCHQEEVISIENNLKKTEQYNNQQV